uniref:G-protein coupled receptors family 2 profile 2 domain-containing protein n=1 Tax=Panagrolaimus superbus TaxID=310955 RepID=A0A914Y197_9BILA
MLVQVFSSKRSRKPCYYIFAYGFPAIVSGVSFYLNPQGFGTERHCWLSTENYFIYTFVGPVAAVLFCNLLFLLMTFCIVCKHSNVGYKPCKHDYDTIKMIRSWLKGSFALIFLLGLTWTLGFFWIDQKTVWVAYVFTVFNTLQGVCIFLFHIWLNDKMHIDYENWVRRNDWLPSCLRDPTLNIRDRRTGPYVPSTATSSAHTGTSDSSGSDGMNSQSLPRKLREYNKRPHSRTNYEFSTDDSCNDPLLYTGQCPNCSHSTTILYSASNTLRGGEYSEKPLPEAPCDNEAMLAFYTATPKKQRTPLAAINYPGQQWTLDRFGKNPSHSTHATKRLYNPSLKEAMGNGSYHQQPQQHRMTDETYDYATIPYDDALNRPYTNNGGSTQFNAFRTNYGVDLYPSSNNTLNESHFPRPPPNFKPPPPPQVTGMVPLSDDSAYSDSSSRSPNSAVSRNGTMLLRMDLTKNPPVFVEGV